jgi:hypothetical protein
MTEGIGSVLKVDAKTLRNRYSSFISNVFEHDNHKGSKWYAFYAKEEGTDAWYG